MLVIFLLLSYLLESGKILFATWIVILFIFVMVVLSLYTLITGTIIGTKTTRRIRAFDRKRWGKTKWKLLNITEVVLYSGMGVGLIYLVFNTDFDFDFHFHDRSLSTFTFPFIGSWVGYNLGEIIRIFGLKEQAANG
ncbi:hypothetical protein [Planococcus maritimus]|uniref:hypothetical protein n=1 Tax=Planococcus maritimus TaxID=192421 RepID=UPI001ABFF6D1|nr:hypothetical protein [Planococcus maritimus]